MHQDVVGRFCERFILSLTDCASCLVISDQLEVLPISSHITDIQAVPAAVSHEKQADDAELVRLKADMADVKPIGTMLKLCKTLDQAKVRFDLPSKPSYNCRSLLGRLAYA